MRTGNCRTMMLTAAAADTAAPTRCPINTAATPHSNVGCCGGFSLSPMTEDGCLSGNVLVSINESVTYNIEMDFVPIILISYPFRLNLNSHLCG